MDAPDLDAIERDLDDVERTLRHLDDGSYRDDDAGGVTSDGQAPPATERPATRA